VAESLDGELSWTIAAVHTDSETPRAEPFEAIVLELGWLWADPQ
jgi:hypothetical protein